MCALSAMILFFFFLALVCICENITYFLLILSSVAADQSGSVSFLHLLYCVPGGALVTWNGRAGIMALQIPLSQHSVGPCLFVLLWETCLLRHMCAGSPHSLISPLVITFLHELESIFPCAVCWSRSTVKRFRLCLCFLPSVFSGPPSDKFWVSTAHSWLFWNSCQTVVQGEPRGGQEMAIVGGSCWKKYGREISNKCWQQQQWCCAGAWNQGCTRDRWRRMRRMWRLGCWGALGRTWEDMGQSWQKGGCEWDGSF